MQTFAEKFGSLVGLHPEVPNCLPAGMTAAEITTSDSGRFITDTDELNLKLQDALDDCGPDSLWPLLKAARRSALDDTYTDLLTNVGSLNKQRFLPFKGEIGGTDYKGLVPVTDGQTLTTSIRTKQLPGAVLMIKGIGLLVDSDVDVWVNVPGSSSPFLVVCAANTPSRLTLPAPVLVPLEGETLSFSYEINGFSPYNTKLSCGCSGMLQRASEYLPKLTDSPANGLLIDAELTCDPFHVISESADAIPAVYRVIAAAIRHKSLEKAIERIQNSGVVDRYTMMESQYLWGRRNAYRSDYQDCINWLVSPEGFNMELTACYQCKPKQMFRAQIKLT